MPFSVQSFAGQAPRAVRKEFPSEPYRRAAVSVPCTKEADPS
jgi:hypothetical protein